MITEWEFYDDPGRGAARRASGEVDFGVMWVDGDRDWPQWRVSWVEATGEVYAVELGPRDGAEGSRRLQLLGEAATRQAVDVTLAGWADQEDWPSRLDWVRGRLAASAAGRTIH